MKRIYILIILIMAANNLTLVSANESFSFPFQKEGSKLYDIMEEVEMPASNYFIFNHSSAKWDKERKAQEGIQKLLEIFKKQNSSSFRSVLLKDMEGFIYPDAYQKYYVFQNDVDETALSTSGAHNLNFTGSKNFILAGGNFVLCLCEAIRDVIRSAASIETPISIFLVKDAIYGFFNYTLKHRGNLFQEAAFNVNTLEYLLENMSEHQRVEYVRFKILGVPSLKRPKDGQIKLCPFQDFEDTLDLLPYNYSFTLNGLSKQAYQIKSGRLKVNIIFTNTEQLMHDFKKFSIK